MSLWRPVRSSGTRGGTARRSASSSTPTTIFGEITDDLLYHGDLNAALRRMMQSGFRDRNGERMQGMREMLEKLRRKRRDELERYDLGGVYDDIAQELRDVVDRSARRSTSWRRRRASRATSAARRSPSRSSQEHRLQLDMLPPDLAGQVRELQKYDFTSTEARERSRSCSTSSASSSCRATSTRWPAR